MRRTIVSAAVIPTVGDQTPTKIRKGAVRRQDWERYQLDGGALVIYPPKKGGEMTGMIVLAMAEVVPLEVAPDTRPRKSRR